MATLGCFAGFEGFDCSILWIIMVLIFFLAAITRRQIADQLLGMDFSLIASSILGELSFVIVIIITKSYKFGLLAGIVGLLAGGFIGSKFLGGESTGGFE